MRAMFLENVEAAERVVCGEMPPLVCFSLFLAYFAAYAIHTLYH